MEAGRHAVFVSPVYLVNQLYVETRGDERLSSNVVTNSTFDTTKEGGETLNLPEQSASVLSLRTVGREAPAPSGGGAN